MARKNKNNIALFLAILFHISGAMGILFTPYKDWFIRYTPLTLLLMAALLIFTQEQKNKSFWLFAIICFFTGLATEMIGVNTAFLFGNYAYGTVMGYKLNGVPLLIGLNWFVIIFCSGNSMYQLLTWIEKKYASAGIQLSSRIKTASLIFDSALLATFFDYIMEPVAVKLGFWQWHNNQLPFYNYFCWFMTGTLLLFLFNRMPFNKHNHFAVHLFIIQLLFFLALRLYL